MLDRLVERASSSLATRTTRRSFLGRVGIGVVAAAGGPFVVAALKPERAEAYHICGHTYTTNSCPHPYSPLSRVDKYGYPIHPKYGYKLDVNGDPYTSRNQTIERMCEETVKERYPYVRDPAQGGGWSRCCNGRVRRIYDCCGYTATRINGDGAVTGYCYRGKRVFCVGYRDLNVRC